MYVGEKIGEQPDAAVILGSGLGVYANRFSDAVTLPYEEIPHFPKGTNKAHAYRMHLVRVGEKKVLLLSGRYHYYEGFSMEQVVYPTRVLRLLGVEKLVVTNAAGGLNPGFSVGDFMLITDHVKFFTESPARGGNIDELGPRFFDMSHAYDPQLRALAKEAAASCGIGVQEGVYAFMPGPQFETPAEIRALRTLGCDAVGMSTVPEVIAAAHCGIQVLGISCISNMAAGILDAPITDEEVVEITSKRAGDFQKLLGAILEKI
ncbi:purine-nucleoside phosphorylase [Oscillospiraceae bacterium NSJ-54]|uniref:purine-nucleoside phosphorylase n=2 Tax=Zongyangia hominis TaxID=2763677 RepID=A0A926E8G2_9FIRM|nr:purine-nucleoside phosphorylase [Zongyangia hominis]